ncbi:MAG: four helix bundle protein [Fimbriimonadaceae bacterium]
MADHKPIEDTSVYLLFSQLAEEVWLVVPDWDSFAKWTIGKQLVEAAGRITANLVEGDGRFSDPDANRFFVTARGSTRETREFIKKAGQRNLISAERTEIMTAQANHGPKQLNGLIACRRQTGLTMAVREDLGEYFDSVSDLSQRSTLNAKRYAPF